MRVTATTPPIPPLHLHAPACRARLLDAQTAGEKVRRMNDTLRRAKFMAKRLRGKPMGQAPEGDF